MFVVLLHLIQCTLASWGWVSEQTQTLGLVILGNCERTARWARKASKLIDPLFSRLVSNVGPHFCGKNALKKEIEKDQFLAAQ